MRPVFYSRSSTLRDPYRRFMRTALTLICATLLAASVGARPADAKDKAESSPEVAEAAELTAKVVKLSNEGKYQEALPLAQRALELREKALGREHPLVGDALLNLAVITRNLGKIEESKGFYLRAEAIYEKGGDESAKGLISILDGLSRVEAYLPKAVELQERSLALKVKVYGPESPQITSSLFALGHLNDILGNYE
jgi:tetratricopeptide (TPR) repeat protein